VDVEMEVRRVVVDDVARAPVVLLEDKEHTTTLPIWIGVAEAQAIALEMEGIQSPRPLTHDLLKQLLERLDVTFERAVITELREGTYYAHPPDPSRERLGYRQPAERRDCLAVRFRKPVFVARRCSSSHERWWGSGVATTEDIGGLTVQQLCPTSPSTSALMCPVA
jgi:hypothetical protein